jgi:hypothetical protein
MLLSGGKITLDGDSEWVTEKYLQPQGFADDTLINQISEHDDTVEILQISVNDSANTTIKLPESRNTIRISIEGSLTIPNHLEVEAQITDLQGRPLGFYSPGHQYGRATLYSEGNFKITRVIKLPRINKGEYYLNIYLTDPGLRFFMKIENKVKLIASGNTTETGWTFEYSKGAGWVLLEDLPEN